MDLFCSPSINGEYKVYEPSIKYFGLLYSPSIQGEHKAQEPRLYSPSITGEHQVQEPPSSAVNQLGANISYIGFLGSLS